MKQKTTLLIILAASVLLMAGAYVLYDTLSEKVDPNQLAADQPSNPTEPQDATDPQDPTDPQRPQAPDFTVYDENGNAV